MGAADAGMVALLAALLTLTAAGAPDPDALAQLLLALDLRVQLGAQ